MTCERRYDAYDEPCGRCAGCRADDMQRAMSNSSGQLDRIEAMLAQILEKLA